LRCQTPSQGTWETQTSSKSPLPSPLPLENTFRPLPAALKKENNKAAASAMSDMNAATEISKINFILAYGELVFASIIAYDSLFLTMESKYIIIIQAEAEPETTSVLPGAASVR
jgi:hypothetical protein